MQINKRGFLKFWMPVFLYAGFIFYISSIPSLSLPVRFPYADKLAHIAEYALLGWLLSRAFKYSFGELNKTKLYWIVTAVSFLYGLSDEFHQLFVFNRACSIGDVLADSVGGLIGVFIFL